MTNLDTLITTLSASLSSRPAPSVEDLANLAKLLPLVQGTLQTTLLPWQGNARHLQGRTEGWLRIEPMGDAIIIWLGPHFLKPEGIAINPALGEDFAKALADLLARAKGYVLVDSTL